MAKQLVYVNIARGDPAPWFRQRAPGNQMFAIEAAGGRYIVLCFYGSAADEHGKAAIAAVHARRDLFNGVKCTFFGISIDPQDEAERRVAPSVPGIRFLWDFDGAVSRLYGSLPADAGQPGPARRLWMVLDPTLRTIDVIPFRPDGSDVASLLAFLDALPPVPLFAGIEIMAPVLYLPNVFEPELCRRLIDEYERNGGEESGFMREVDGKTLLLQDRRRKRRRDHILSDKGLIDEARARIGRRIMPEIEKAFQFKATRMERHIVACYSADDGGFFTAHRDNLSKGTAHRRFAVSINLNGEFEGGELSFPEYGPRRFRPPAGCAVVFSCSLLHAVSPVTRGERFAYLPFLYDEAAAKTREESNQFLGEDVPRYSR